MTYCVRCKKVTGFVSKPMLVQTKNRRHMIRGKCSVCGRTKTQFVNKGSGILSMLGIKTPLSKIPVVGPLLF